MLEGDTRKKRKVKTNDDFFHTSIEQSVGTHQVRCRKAAVSFGYVKYPRAHGGCLGSRRRRRT